MGKLGKYFCCIVCAFSVCICVSGCGNQKNQSITFKQKEEVSPERSVPTASPLIGVDGGTQEYFTILNAEDIRQEEKVKWYIDEIQKIVHNAPGYEEAYEDLLSFADIAVSS